MVGYSNRIAFPEGQEDNISQRMGSTVHDDDFDQAINMISDDIDRQNAGDIEKAKLSQMDEFGVSKDTNVLTQLSVKVLYVDFNARYYNMTFNCTARLLHNTNMNLNTYSTCLY